jgi:hypothetical protein
MNYEQEEFFELIERVEDQGGELLEEICRARKYEFTGDKIKPVTLAGCSAQALFRLPYDALDVKGNEVGVQPVVVCAVDDSMGAWPRFGGDLGVEP